MTLDPSSPFAAKSLHPAAGPVLGAHWGAHGGPMVTSVSFSAPAESARGHALVDRRRGRPPPRRRPRRSGDDASFPTTSRRRSAHFWSIDGFVDLPFGSVALQAYSGTGDQFNGEAFLFSKNYDTVVARANVNGFYSGVGVTDGHSATRIVYSALSAFASAASTTSESGLWASDVTTSSLAASTTPNVKLFDWTGSSGPVVSDQDGNVFTAAFISTTGAPHTDEIYAVSQKQALGTAAVTQATVVDADTKGTASLAVASVKGSGNGWIFAKGFDGAAPAPVYARAYTSADGAVASNGDVVSTRDQAVGTTRSPSSARPTATSGLRSRPTPARGSSSSRPKPTPLRTDAGTLLLASLGVPAVVVACSSASSSPSGGGAPGIDLNQPTTPTGDAGGTSPVKTTPTDAGDAGATSDDDAASDNVTAEYLTKVVSFTPGTCAGFGSDQMPGIVLGPPKGGGNAKGGLDVVSLGTGGTIIVSLEPNAIVDRPGVDFIVYENAFYPGGNIESAVRGAGRGERQR